MNVIPQGSAAFQDEVANYVSAESMISTIYPRQGRMRVTQPRSKWVVDLSDRFDELTSLPFGWDGYAGRPVSFNCAQFAANLVERLFVRGVPTPNLVPGCDGTLQIEWHRSQFDIEIHVIAPYEILATRYDHLAGIEQQLELQTDFAELGEWIVDLQRDHAQIERAKA